jgi:hypothetical protein
MTKHIEVDIGFQLSYFQPMILKLCLVIGIMNNICSKGVSIYLQKLFGNRVRIFTIQCKTMHTKPKNMGAYHLCWRLRSRRAVLQDTQYMPHKRSASHDKEFIARSNNRTQG